MTAVLGPTEARTILELAAVPTLRLEHVVTRRVIAAIPPEHADYRPEAGARTAVELARHIVATEVRFLNGATAGKFDMRSVADDVPDIPTLVSMYEREFAAALDRLTAVTGDELIRVLDYRGVVKMPALGFVQLALNHTIHHRGQLSVHLRSVGARVPPIYG